MAMFEYLAKGIHVKSGHRYFVGMPNPHCESEDDLRMGKNLFTEIALVKISGENFFLCTFGRNKTSFLIPSREVEIIHVF